MSAPSAHLDTFARDRMPAAEALPRFINLDALGYPERLNIAAELVDRAVVEGDGGRPCLRGADGTVWSYAETAARVDAAARVLVEDLGLVPGERVLLRSANCPELAVAWLAVVKAGGIVVNTMPLLRAADLAPVVERARPRIALVADALTAELEAARSRVGVIETLLPFSELAERAARHDAPFPAVATAADDICMIAFTSGTTGTPKGALHFHRDLLASCDTFSAQVLRPRADDCFLGSPPLAFTYGLGGLLLFPLRARASTLLVEDVRPEALAEAIARHRPSVLVTAPVAYRRLLDVSPDTFASLRRCLSAGEPLPRPVFEAWEQATGLRIIDGLGSTEMFHIFIASADDAIRPGSTGLVVPGYEARVVDDALEPVPDGEVGRLAVRGPTGCKYLDDPRQAAYVQGGWNLTGDAYVRDADGYFWFQARTDDMIVSAGYNIAGPEVEAALLTHPAVAECAVVGVPDAERGQVVKAFVVPRDGAAADPERLARELQEHVKRTIAPFKYPRQVEFIDALPRTGTGKVQRYRLRQAAARRAGPEGSGTPPSSSDSRARAR